jgi:hypothetical protein
MPNLKGFDGLVISAGRGKGKERKGRKMRKQRKL